MPRIVRPTPRAPIDVVSAVGVFDSELKVALIAHFRGAPGSQTAAAAALKVAQPLVSRNVEALTRAGVLITSVDPEDKRKRIYRVDDRRLVALHDALRAFTAPPSDA